MRKGAFALSVARVLCLSFGEAIHHSSGYQCLLVLEPDNSPFDFKRFAGTFSLSLADRRSSPEPYEELPAKHGEVGTLGIRSGRPVVDLIVGCLEASIGRAGG